MGEVGIFQEWQPRYAQLWGRVALKLRHGLADDPLFSDATLARLIETYPREHYQLMQPATTPGGSAREGEMTGVPGEAVLAAIAKGRMWVNLRRVDEVDPRFLALADRIFTAIATAVPGFSTMSRTLGILVSSPRSRTHYHADLPGQALWQIRGRKRLYLYQAAEPFVTREQIERITVSRSEFIPYEPWYDDHAAVFDLGPGDMVHWPLNAPHRVDNADCLNVSMTMEFFTPEIRRRHIVNRANGILRLLNVEPGGAPTSGVGYYARAALQRALRDTPMVRRHDAMADREPTFRPDPSRPDAVADLR